MHIRDQVVAALEAQGWEFGGTYSTYKKVIENFAEAGTLSSGRRLVRLELEPNGRWFQRLDGWGNEERCVDLRDHANAETAIAAVLA